jgi:hypothetical protein
MVLVFGLYEVAHVVLRYPEDHITPRPVKEAMAEAVALLCCEALGWAGTESARGYLQAWLRGNELSEESSQRIIPAAQVILSTGAQGGPRFEVVARSRLWPVGFTA